MNQRDAAQAGVRDKLVAIVRGWKDMRSIQRTLTFTLTEWRHFARQNGLRWPTIATVERIKAILRGDL